MHERSYSFRRWLYLFSIAVALWKALGKVEYSLMFGIYLLLSAQIAS